MLSHPRLPQPLDCRRIFPCVVKYAEIMAREIEEHYSKQQSISSSPDDSACNAPAPVPDPEEQAAPAGSFLGGVVGGFKDAVQSGWGAAKSFLGRGGQQKQAEGAGKQGEDGSAEASTQHGAAKGIDIQHLLEESLLNVFVEGLFDIRAEDFPGELWK